MGKTYIKEENGEKVLYEEGSFVDKRLGELYENLDGSLETRNSFSENYHVKEERSSFKSHPDCTIESSENKSGTLKYESSSRHRYEGELKSRKNSLEDSLSEDDEWDGWIHGADWEDPAPGSDYHPEEKTKWTVGERVVGAFVYPLLFGGIAGLLGGVNVMLKDEYGIDIPIKANLIIGATIGLVYGIWNLFKIIE